MRTMKTQKRISRWKAFKLRVAMVRYGKCILLLSLFKGSGPFKEGLRWRGRDSLEMQEFLLAHQRKPLFSKHSLNSFLITNAWLYFYLKFDWNNFVFTHVPLTHHYCNCPSRSLSCDKLFRNALWCYGGVVYGCVLKIFSEKL